GRPSRGTDPRGPLSGRHALSPAECHRCAVPFGCACPPEAAPGRAWRDHAARRGGRRDRRDGTARASRAGRVGAAAGRPRPGRGRPPVQAGAGTGKSSPYLGPRAAHAMASGSSVVVATATIALQRQLIDRALPRLAAALEPLLGRPPTFAILKGRGNYVCRYR